MKQLQVFRTPVEHVIRERITKATDAIDAETDDYIRGVNETEYVDHVYSQFAFGIPRIDFSQRSGDVVQRPIPATMFRGFIPPGTHSLPRPVIRTFLPCSGDMPLLVIRPSSYSNFTASVTVDDEGIWFEYPILEPAFKEAIKAQQQADVNGFQGMYQTLVKDLESGNRRLQSEIGRHVNARKQRLAEGERLLESWGIPLKRTPDRVSYAAPVTVRKSVLPRPKAGEKSEPILADAVYEEILEIAQGLGKAFERHPATYRNVEEEALRDHFVLHLEPRFAVEGAATGETFNKVGKTDILIRYRNMTVFVAECKWWAGEKAYLDALTQMLGYVTWRDTKTAILLFVRNKRITPVLNAITKTTPSHPNFVAEVTRMDDGPFRYTFHLNGDRDRHLTVAVQVFHFPDVAQEKRKTPRTTGSRVV